MIDRKKRFCYSPHKYIKHKRLWKYMTLWLSVLTTVIECSCICRKGLFLFLVRPTVLWNSRSSNLKANFWTHKIQYICMKFFCQAACVLSCTDKYFTVCWKTVLWIINQLVLELWFGVAHFIHVTCSAKCICCSNENRN